MTTLAKKRAVRGLLAIAAAVAVFVGVVGFAHTSRGRFLLAHLPGMGTCPVGKPATAEQIDRARGIGRAAVRGTEVARARPALGFELDRTTKRDVLAWADEHGIACRDEAAKLKIACENVPAGALAGARGDAELLRLWVDREDRLVGVELTRRRVSFDDAVALVDARAAEVASVAGGAPKRTGVESGAQLRAGLLNVAQAELRFTTYRFVVSARNHGGEAPIVSERYQAIDDTNM